MREGPDFPRVILGLLAVEALLHGLVELGHGLPPVAEHQVAQRAGGAAGVLPGGGVVLGLVGGAGALEELLGLDEQVLGVGRPALDAPLPCAS